MHLRKGLPRPLLSHQRIMVVKGDPEFHRQILDVGIMPQKTQLVYCKDVNRHGDYPNQSFDFLGYRFRPRKSIWHGYLPVVSFLPAVSPKALKAMGQTLRRWRLHHRSDKSLQDLARLYNSHIRGWINYYSHFYGSALHPVLHRVDAYLVR